MEKYGPLAPFLIRILNLFSHFFHFFHCTSEKQILGSIFTLGELVFIGLKVSNGAVLWLSDYPHPNPFIGARSQTQDLLHLKYSLYTLNLWLNDVLHRYVVCF